MPTTQMTDDELNGLPMSSLKLDIWNDLLSYTSEFHNMRMDKVRRTLERLQGPIWISLGENCGPGIKIRDSNLPHLGGNFFDNLVCPIESMIELVSNRFDNILCLKNLIIGEWENHDSVYDAYHKLYYHHYFHPTNLEYMRREKYGDAARRIIRPEDIPLFYRKVVSQFEYLADKFILLLRCEIDKYYVLRRVDGRPVDAARTQEIYKVLERLGGRAFALRIVFSNEDENITYDSAIHRFIPERDERWGAPAEWKRVLGADSPGFVSLGRRDPASKSLEIYDLARDKPASQSSRSQWSHGTTVYEDASRANSGALPLDFAFHTGLDAEPWWTVDLGALCSIQAVEVLNRPRFEGRFRAFRIETSVDGENWVTNFTKFDDQNVSSAPERPATFEFAQAVPARHLRIVNLSAQVLHLRRVRVLGSALPGGPSEAPNALSVCDPTPQRLSTTT